MGMPASFFVSAISCILSFYHKKPEDRKKLLVRYRPDFYKRNDTIGIAERSEALERSYFSNSFFIRSITSGG
jgi:hypothetical protein